MAAWSKAIVGGLSIKEMCRACKAGCGSTVSEELFEKTEVAAYEIIAKKGATHCAMATAVANVLESIFRDERRILIVSTYVDDYMGVGDLYNIELPAILSSKGVAGVLKLDLDVTEKELFVRSARVIKNALSNIEHLWTAQ